MSNRTRYARRSCPACGKPRYGRKFALMIAARQAKATGERIHAYKCHRGHAWHTGHARDLPGDKGAPRLREIRKALRLRA